MAFPDGWQYSKTATLTVTLGGYVLPIIVQRGSGVDTGGAVYLPTDRVRADFADVRFTDGGNNLLDYYLADLTGNVATYRVECAADTTVKIWYGNPVATTAAFAPNVGAGTDFNQPRQMISTTGYYDVVPAGDAVNGRKLAASPMEEGIVVRDGVTYMLWLQPQSTYKMSVVACAYNHRTQQYSVPFYVWQELDNTDSHSAPALAIDASGNFHAFCCSHVGNQRMLYKKSTTFVGLETTPEQGADLYMSDGKKITGTYPVAFCIGDDVYCFFRGSDLGLTTGDTGRYSFIKWDNTNQTWTCSPILRTTYYSGVGAVDSRIYGRTIYDSQSDRIYIAFATKVATYTTGVDVYKVFAGQYLIYSADHGVTWKTIDNSQTFSYALGNLPVESQADCFDTALAPAIGNIDSLGRILTVNIDPVDGYPAVLQFEPQNIPNVYTQWQGRYRMSRWTGTAWATHYPTTDYNWGETGFKVFPDGRYLIAGLQNNSALKSIDAVWIEANRPTQTADWTVGSLIHTEAAATSLDSVNPIGMCRYSDEPDSFEICYGDNTYTSVTGSTNRIWHHRLSDPAYSAWTINEPNYSQTPVSKSVILHGLLGKLYFYACRSGTTIDPRAVCNVTMPINPVVEVDFVVTAAPVKISTGAYEAVCISDSAVNFFKYNGTNPANSIALLLQTTATDGAVQASVRHVRAGTAAINTTATNISLSANLRYYATLRYSDSTRTAARIDIYSDSARTQLVGTATTPTQTAIASALTYINVSGIPSSNADKIKVDYNSVTVGQAADTLPTISAWAGGMTTPTITWSNPAAITYGTALSATQLNATASVPGTFTYSPAAGTVLSAGSHTVIAIFTPTDTANYTTVTYSVSITVDTVAATVNLSGLTHVYNGAAKSATATTIPEGLPVSMTYNEVATAPTASGVYAVFATVTSPNYTGSASGAMEISKADPAIIWAPPSTLVVGTVLSSAQLNATASVPGSFVYSPAAGTTLTTSGTQSLSVVFTPTDTANYNGATASRTVTVTWKIIPVITWATPAAVKTGTALSGIQLNATASVPGSFVYTPPLGTILSTVGSAVLSAIFTPTDTATYESVSASVSVQVYDWIPPGTTTVDAILNTQLPEDYAADGFAPTLRQAIYMILQLLTEKHITGTTMTVNKLDGTTPAMTFELDNATDPTSITRRS